MISHVLMFASNFVFTKVILIACVCASFVLASLVKTRLNATSFVKMDKENLNMVAAT